MVHFGIGQKDHKGESTEENQTRKKGNDRRGECHPHPPNLSRRSMILPILAYGDPVLKKTCSEIDPDHPGLHEFIENLFETMYAAKGVGLAAPQVGKDIRVFVVDGSPFAENNEEYKHLEGFKRVFINPEIVEESGEEWEFNEGCLSIPDVREEITRKNKIRIVYDDPSFEEQEEEFEGLAARIVQHEYDHIEGILFTDHLSPLKKRLLKRKLDDISKGNVEVDYKMRFPKAKKAI